MERPPLADVITRHARALRAHAAVVGLAEGRTDEGEPCVLLMLAAPWQDCPEHLEGWPVRAVVSGPLEAREDPTR